MIGGKAADEEPAELTGVGAGEALSLAFKESISLLRSFLVLADSCSLALRSFLSLFISVLTFDNSDSLACKDSWIFLSNEDFNFSKSSLYLEISRSLALMMFWCLPLPPLPWSDCFKSSNSLANEAFFVVSSWLALTSCESLISCCFKVSICFSLVAMVDFNLLISALDSTLAAATAFETAVAESSFSFSEAGDGCAAVEFLAGRILVSTKLFKSLALSATCCFNCSTSAIADASPWVKAINSCSFSFKTFNNSSLISVAVVEGACTGLLVSLILFFNSLISVVRVETLNSIELFKLVNSVSLSAN
ncbi:hypothetical protein WICPIJ_004896 [Wickerhamomyces pijperi]|uniref:Uncharacterized protein n=1 Tax=Wickerhamomyces pijperi TaxID=599730 RepID=A0A9P8Q755_WICPI|nr:hypothetical protein WICPIJ_004896 [Wickerhamomyces pijperi]